MMSPEIKALREIVLTVETKRALENARNIALKNNTDIGVLDLYNGICQEMGQLHVQTTLERNHINVDDLEKELNFAAELETQHGDWKKSDPKLPLRLTGLSQSAQTNALKIWREKNPNINPPVLSPSYLLLGLATLNR